MVRRLAALLMATALVMAGCGARNTATPTSADNATKTQSTATADKTPAPATTTNTAQGGATAAATTPAGTTQPVSGTAGSAVGTAASGDATQAAPSAPPEDPLQAAHWYPRDIGYPMTTDDEKVKGAKVVMLTFDDGPTKDVTPKILDILKENNVKALFFVTGYGIKNVDMLKREAAEGHTIGTHTMTHDDLTKMTEQQVRDEVNPVNEQVEKILGQKPKYFRPPFGSYNKTVLKVVQDEDKMFLMNWDDGSLDWDHVDSKGWKDPNQVVKDTMDQLHAGAVILMHDTHMHTAEALPEIIKQIRAKGYEFVVMR